MCQQTDTNLNGVAREGLTEKMVFEGGEKDNNLGFWEEECSRQRAQHV